MAGVGEEAHLQAGDRIVLLSSAPEDFITLMPADPGTCYEAKR